MTDDNYMNAIREAQNLLNELLNDPDHGKLTFKGINGLDDLIITQPQELDDLISGTVLVIDRREWMALTTSLHTPRPWQCFRHGTRVTSKELYTLALMRPSDLTYCHVGL